MWVSELREQGCCWKPTPFEEYEIPKVVIPINYPELRLPLSEEEPCLGELKEKVIDEYFKILDQLECGITPDLDFILDEILAIETFRDLDNKEYILQYYVTNEKYY